MTLQPESVVITAALALALGCGGVALAWWMRTRTTLSIRNLYPAAALGLGALVTVLALHAWEVSLIVLPLAAPWAAGATVGARWRSADLGAGEELRNHELARRWIWQPAPERRDGERLYLRSQGELVHARGWPSHIDYVSMTAPVRTVRGCRSAPASTSSCSARPAPARRPPRGG